MDREPIQVVIFDLGGVVIDWNPRYLYQKIFFGDPARMELFLSKICSFEWNELQDAGRSLALATEERIREFPEWEREIRVYYGRWIEMINGVVPGTEDVMRELVAHGVRLFALSNWNRETFCLIHDRFPLLYMFENIFISSDYGYAKPDLRFYRRALNEIKAPLKQILFVDDNRRNVVAAGKIGLKSILFKNARSLRDDLQSEGIELR